MQNNDTLPLKIFLEAILNPRVCRCPDAPGEEDIKRWASEGEYPKSVHKCSVSQKCFDFYKMAYERTRRLCISRKK
ncbi:hypothetical protein KKB41_03965 [Patescibacteria group bacterium]|nr:hypothetical protein [Patescibacteria group bacterium]